MQDAMGDIVQSAIQMFSTGLDKFSEFLSKKVVKLHEGALGNLFQGQNLNDAKHGQRDPKLKQEAEKLDERAKIFEEASRSLTFDMRCTVGSTWSRDVLADARLGSAYTSVGNAFKRIMRYRLWTNLP